ncbi:MAG: hypothetical protein DRP90_06225 [Planctomycetota bacterium]|nr:MAG: hypothetical protein DRP90_06225 [Planctomycetota bacterium]
MLKKLLIAAAVLLVVVAVVVLFFLGPIVRPIAEARGTRTLGAKVSLDSLSISPLAGSVEMADLTVANPEGFHEGPFLLMERFRAGAALGSMLSSVVELPEVVVDGLQLEIEARGGKTNLGAILAKLDESVGDGEAEGESEGGKRFRIKKLELKNIRVSMQSDLAGRVNLSVGDFELHDIGTHKSAGATLSQVLFAVFKALASRIDDAAGKLGGEAKKIVEKGGFLHDLGKVGSGRGKNIIEKVKKPLKNLFR